MKVTLETVSCHIQHVVTQTASLRGHIEACICEYIHSLAEALIQNDSKRANKMVCVSLKGSCFYFSTHDGQDNLRILWLFSQQPAHGGEITS